MRDLVNYSLKDLLALHVGIMDQLRDRGIMRSANNPTGDLAEYLFCQAFGWQQASNSVKAFDATDGDGIRYQIKGRRLNRFNGSRQLSAIRDLDGFDMLAAVLFDHDYRIFRAALIPSEVARTRAKFVEHTNSNRFMLTDSIWDAPEVTDVTDALRAVEAVS